MGGDVIDMVCVLSFQLTLVCFFVSAHWMFQSFLFPYQLLSINNTPVIKRSIIMSLL